MRVVSNGRGLGYLSHSLGRSNRSFPLAAQPRFHPFLSFPFPPYFIIPTKWILHLASHPPQPLFSFISLSQLPHLPPHKQCFIPPRN